MYSSALLLTKAQLSPTSVLNRSVLGQHVHRIKWRKRTSYKYVCLCVFVRCVNFTATPEHLDVDTDRSSRRATAGHRRSLKADLTVCGHAVATFLPENLEIQKLVGVLW